jgi:hypothetical protein
MIASLPIEATRARFQTRPSDSDNQVALKDQRGDATAALPYRLSHPQDSRRKPSGSRGGLSSLDRLQEGQGMPAPPQPQAFAPSQGRSA